MKKVFLSALIAACATLPLAAQADTVAKKGAELVSSDGSRLGPVYRITADDGSAQIIIDGKFITVPAATLSMNDGKLMTSLKKAEVISIR